MNAIIEPNVDEQASRALKQGVDLGVVQAEDRFLTTTPEERPATLNEVLEAEEKLAEERAALDAKKEQAMGVMQQWDNLLRRRDGMAARLATAREDAAMLRSEASKMEQHLFANQIGIHTQLPREQLLTVGGFLSSQAAILALIECWITRGEKELSGLEKEVIDFAKEHGIELPL